MVNVNIAKVFLGITSSKVSICTKLCCTQSGCLLSKTAGPEKDQNLGRCGSY